MLYAAGVGSHHSRPGHEQSDSRGLGTLTLLASGIGGVLFGFIADRIGRKRR